MSSLAFSLNGNKSAGSSTPSLMGASGASSTSSPFTTGGTGASSGGGTAGSSMFKTPSMGGLSALSKGFSTGGASSTSKLFSSGGGATGTSTGATTGGSSFSTPGKTGGFSLGGTTGGGGSSFSLGGATGGGSSFSTPNKTGGLSLGGTSGGRSSFSLGGMSGGSSFSTGGSSMFSKASGGGGFSMGAQGGGGGGGMFNTGGSMGTSGAPDHLKTATAIARSYGYTPDCKQYSQFMHAFYNVVNPMDVPSYGKLPYVPDQIWNAAVKDNPDSSRLVPAVAVGFEELKGRVEEQDKMANVLAGHLLAIQKKIGEIKQKHESLAYPRIQAVKQQHRELMHRVVQLMARMHVLKAAGCRSLPAEESLTARLENLHRELNKPTQFRGQLNELSSLVRMQEDSLVKEPRSLPVDHESKDAIYKFLKQQQEGLATLSAVLTRDMEDLKYIHKMMEGRK